MAKREKKTKKICVPFNGKGKKEKEKEKRIKKHLFPCIAVARYVCPPPPPWSASSALSVDLSICRLGSEIEISLAVDQHRVALVQNDIWHIKQTSTVFRNRLVYRLMKAESIRTHRWLYCIAHVKSALRRFLVEVIAVAYMRPGMHGHPRPSDSWGAGVYWSLAEAE